MVLQNLPLKEDEEEFKIVYDCINHLLVHHNTLVSLSLGQCIDHLSTYHLVTLSILLYRSG